MLTPMLMNNTKLEQRFLVETDVEICGLNISFATYKRNVDCPIDLLLTDGFGKNLFCQTVKKFNDNVYTKIDIPKIKLEGGMYYALTLIGHSNNIANAVSLWFNEKVGSTLTVNRKVFQNNSINFNFEIVPVEIKEKSDTVESIAQEVVVVRKRGRPKK